MAVDQNFEETSDRRRLQFEGFSVLPPRGGSWSIQNRRTNGVSLTRITTKGAYHTVMAWARSSETEFTRYAGPLRLARRGLLSERDLKRTQGTQWEDSRYKLLEEKLTLDGSVGSECLRLDFSVEDRGVPYAPDLVFVLIGQDFYCLHPDSSNLVVRIAYSQRFLQGEQALPIESEVEPLLRSLEFTPLQSAARELEPPIADANAQDPESQLLEAAENTQTARVKTLLDAVPGVDAKDNLGQTALMRAAFEGQTGTVLALLEDGANVNAKTDHGVTALMNAVGKGQTETVRVLLDAGADVNAKSEMGVTALRVATQAGHNEIVEMLKKAGAKE